MTLKTYPFDASEYLDDDESQAELISGAFEAGSAEHFAHVLGIIARARGMTWIAEELGISRKALYDALVENDASGVQRLQDIAQTLQAKLSLRAADAAAIAANPGDKPPKHAAE